MDFTAPDNRVSANNIRYCYIKNVVKNPRIVVGDYTISEVEMKLFDPAQIPNLMSYADDEREVRPPINPLDGSRLSW